MTALNEVGSFGLLDANKACAVALALFNPLLAQFDLMLFGQFGLGSLQADLSAQFNAALAVSVNVGLSISNPLAGLEASLQALVQLSAGLQAAIALGLPTVSASISAELAASAALSAELGIKLGGIAALLELAIGVKLPAINFLAGLVNAGPVVLLSFGYPANELLLNVGAQTAGMFSAGLTGISPFDEVAGVMLVTKVPSVKIGLSTFIRTT